MQESSRQIGVRQVAHLHHVCVLALTVEADAPPVASALADAVAGTAKIVVAECVSLDDLPAQVCDQLIVTMGLLKAHDRRLIVVNAPPAGLRELRAAGVEVAATADDVFGDDPWVRPDPDALAEAFGRIVSL